MIKGLIITTLNVKGKTMDKLNELMALQKELQKNTFGTDFENMTKEERIALIRQSVLACEDELHEALREVGWKSWATQKYIHEQDLQEELIDALHFLLTLFLCAGMTADDVLRVYRVKHDENERRQREGYSGVAKCPICNKMWDGCHATGKHEYWCANRSFSAKNDSNSNEKEVE